MTKGDAPNFENLERALDVIVTANVAFDTTDVDKLEVDVLKTLQEEDLLDSAVAEEDLVELAECLALTILKVLQIPRDVDVMINEIFKGDCALVHVFCTR